jgi:GxxExxY protein
MTLLMKNRETETLSKEYTDELNRISGIILDCCIEVHRELGPGLLESVYETCLLRELRSRNLKAENQISLPVIYKNEPTDKFFSIDILVENKVLVELKTVEKILPIHKAQTMTYLKLSGMHLGLMINFNVPLVVQGFERVLNGQFPK